MMKRYSIIVAGGSGTRMNASVPKQFLLLKERPILMHTLEKFHHSAPESKLILVLPSDQFDAWKNYCKQYQFTIPHTLISGGSTRFHSVKNALETITDTGIVAIHDGVRPLINKSVIRESFKVAENKGNAITVIPSHDSIRLVTSSENKAVDRNNYVLVQTPQVFDIDLIKKAYQQPYDPLFTDDASVVEKLGMEIFYVEGHRENLKITTPFDLKLAHCILK